MQLALRLGAGVEWVVNRLIRRWLAVINLAVLVYVGLPFLAPLLLANGFTGSANIIYRLYSFACHQLPSRAYYVAGEQVALCYRDVAIYTAMLLGGLAFGVVRRRLKPIPPGWYLLLILPMALDGGTQLLSELTVYIPRLLVVAMGLVALGGLALFLRRRQQLSWYWGVALTDGVVALLYLQLAGSYNSDFFRRTLTGALFGFGTVWLIYPNMEAAFSAETQKLQRKGDSNGG